VTAAWTRLRDDRPTLLGIVLVAVPVLLSLLGPLFTAAPDLVNGGDRLAGPSAQHLFGTDNLGRDTFTRILSGGRTSLFAAIVVTTAITVIGIAVGLISGYYGGWVDAVIMRVVDVLLALPRLILALAVTGVLGPSLPNLMLAIIAVGWADYSRIVRSLVLGLRERPFVESARAVGADPPRIVLRHIAPNLLGQVIVLSTLGRSSPTMPVTCVRMVPIGA